MVRDNRVALAPPPPVVTEESRSDAGSQDNERDTFTRSVGKHEKLGIIKNLMVLSVAFMLHFTAFHGTANLQSSINLDAGTYSLLSIYGSLMIANIFLPVPIIRYLGLKWTISLAFITYMPFVAAQFYPTAATLISSGLSVGLGGAALWCAKCTYLTMAAEAYNVLSGTKKNSNALVVRFFGVFFFFYQTAQVWGNLISSSVLSIKTVKVYSNETLDVGVLCGANFCPGASTAENNPYLIKPDADKINLLSWIFLGCMAAAVLLVATCADSAKKYRVGRTGSGSGLTGWRLFTVTAKQLGHKYQLLLIPATFLVGFDHGFINADFTSAFIACGWGISKIGYAMMCFGIANSIGSAVAAFLTKIIGRFTVVTVNACVHVILLAWLIYWRPESSAVLYCAIAAVWGCVNGIWLVQINALSGILFPGNEEAAFSNYRFIESIGSVAAYVISPLLCMYVKLWILLALIVLGLVGYTTVEQLERKRLRVSQDMDVRKESSLESTALCQTGI